MSQAETSNYYYELFRKYRSLANRYRPRLFTSKIMKSVVGEPITVYYRVEEKKDKLYILYVFVWPDQALPYHKMDYEPVLLEVDRKTGLITRVAYDKLHYTIGKTELNKRKATLCVDTPWRSMTPCTSTNGRTLIFPRPGYNFLPLTLRRYESLTRRTVNPLKINRRIVEDPAIVFQPGTVNWETIREPTPDDILHDLEQNYPLLRRIVNFLRRIGVRIGVVRREKRLVQQ